MFYVHITAYTTSKNKANTCLPTFFSFFKKGGRVLESVDFLLIKITRITCAYTGSHMQDKICMPLFTQLMFSFFCRGDLYLR